MTLSVKGSESSSSDKSDRVLTARTAAHRLESHLVGSRNDEELGRAQAQTRALLLEAARLVTMPGPDEEGETIHGLLEVWEVTRKPGELPKYLVREAGPEPVLYPATYTT